MPTKRVACLAASIKNRGFCYAGKDLDTGRWIRPVSDEEGHAISAYYRVVGKNDPARVGDILSMNVGAEVGAGHQTENVEHRPEHWRRLGTFTFAQALEMVDRPESVWGGGRSTRYGHCDELTGDEAGRYDHSLLLIEVRDLNVICEDVGYGDVKLRTHADFSYNGRHYRLPIADPDHFDYEIGEHEIGRSLLCCSLAEAYEWDDGSWHASKLVAAIITPESLP